MAFEEEADLRDMKEKQGKRMVSIYLKTPYKVM